MTEISASDELMNLAFFALDHGVESVKEGGPLVPFAVIENADGRSLSRFVAETLEEGQEQAPTRFSPQLCGMGTRRSKASERTRSWSRRTSEASLPR